MSASGGGRVTLRGILQEARLEDLLPRFEEEEYDVETLANMDATDFADLVGEFGLKGGQKARLRRALVRLNPLLDSRASGSGGSGTVSSSRGSLGSSIVTPLVAGGGKGELGGGEGAEGGKDVVEEGEMIVELQVLGCAMASDFLVKRKLGGGANGMVVEVQCGRRGHPAPGKSYALKVVYNLGLGTADMHNYQNEFDVLSQLPPHARTTRFFRQFTDRIPDWCLDLLPEAAKMAAVTTTADGSEHRSMSQFLVVEYHPQTLEKLLSDLSSDPSPEQVMQWTVELLEAVAFLSSERCAHLDLKLDNILVSTSGKLVLCDFGTAKRFKDGEMRVKFSRGMSPGGNMRHLPPEVLGVFRQASRLTAAGEEAMDVEVHYAKADLWAVGVLAHEMASRMVSGAIHPIPDYPTAYSRAETLTYPASVVPSLPSTFPPAFRETIKCILQPDPADRPDPHMALAQCTSALLTLKAPPPPSSSISRAPSAPGSLTLFVRTTDSPTVATVELSLSETVETLMSIAAAQLSIPLPDGTVGDLRLLHAGAAIIPSAPLAAIPDLANETSLFLVKASPSMAPSAPAAPAETTSPPPLPGYRVRRRGDGAVGVVLHVEEGAGGGGEAGGAGERVSVKVWWVSSLVVEVVRVGVAREEVEVIGEGEEHAVVEPGWLVCRGKDWRYRDQDGGPGSLGIVAEILARGMVRVAWLYNGKANVYRYGERGHDLAVVSSDTDAADIPAIPKGAIVVRNWDGGPYASRLKDQDGGKYRPGVVLDTTMAGGWVKVGWIAAAGKKANKYRNGIGGGHDVRVVVVTGEPRALEAYESAVAEAGGGEEKEGVAVALEPGTRVVRNERDWMRANLGSQDGRPGNLGTVLERAEAGSRVRVRWDPVDGRAGAVHSYRWHVDGAVDLLVAAHSSSSSPSPSTASAPITRDRLEVGTIVKRGRHWDWGPQDRKPTTSLTAECVGTVSKPANVGEWATVIWKDTYPTSSRYRYRHGVMQDGELKFDLQVVTPPLRPPRIAEGTVVVRGPDYKWGDGQDGGIGNIGIAQERTSDKWVKVRWSNGHVNSYRWGAEGAYDLAIIQT